MGSPPTRRSMLVTAIVATAGCLAGGDSPRTTTARTERATVRTGTDQDRNASAGDPQEATAATDDDPPRDGPDPFYIENRASEDRCVQVSVTNTESDETVLDGTYEVAGTDGIAFSEVGAVGASYAVGAELDTGETLTATWEVRTCPPEFRGEKMNRAGLIRVDDEGPEFTTNQCDLILAGTAESYEWDPDPSSCSV